MKHILLSSIVVTAFLSGCSTPYNTQPAKTWAKAAETVGFSKAVLEKCNFKAQEKEMLHQYNLKTSQAVLNFGKLTFENSNQIINNSFEYYKTRDLSETCVVGNQFILSNFNSFVSSLQSE